MLKRDIKDLMIFTEKIIMPVLRPELIFAVMALVAGLVLVFVNGPFEAPDEPNHFSRAYQISEGRFFSERIDNKAGDRLPASIPNTTHTFKNFSSNSKTKVNKELLISALKTPLNGQERIFVSFPNTVINFPLCYFPQAIGIYAARLVGISPLKMMYAGRMMSLFCWIILMYIAIRLTPVFKWVMVLVGIMPMNLYLAASLSADTMINACAFLFIALVLSERFRDKGLMTMGKRAGIGVVSIALSVMKLVYAPLAAFIFMVPASSFGSNRKRVVYVLSVLGLSLLAIILWGFEIRRVYVPLNNSNMPLQLSNMFADPWKYLCVLANTTPEQLKCYYYTLVGVLGWLEIWLPRWIYVTYIPVIVAASIFEPAYKRRTLYLWEKATFLALCFLSCFLIYTAQYLTWNKAGSLLVEGVTGRYFIPLVIPCMLILFNRIMPQKIKWILGGIVTVYSILVLKATCLAVYMRYYG
jgi:uncharacterized membrane protein